MTSLQQVVSCRCIIWTVIQHIRVCRFGSWTYSSDIVDIRENEPGNVLYLDDYGRACPSIVRNHTSSRNSVFYACCPEPYNDVTITLELAWRESVNSHA